MQNFPRKFLKKLKGNWNQKSSRKIVKKKEWRKANEFRIIESRFPRRNRRVNIGRADLSGGSSRGIRRQSGWQSVPSGWRPFIHANRENSPRFMHTRPRNNSHQAGGMAGEDEKRWGDTLVTVLIVSSSCC